MNRWISILTGLLVAQLVLAITVNLTGKDYGVFQPQEKLLAFESDQVDGLRIEGEAQSVLLRKRDGQWLLPEQGDFPANQQSATRLLDKLAGLEKGWPVATSSGAAGRFEVADDAYQRHLVLLGGDDDLAELYVGTSPGFRKVHVRPEGDDAVYSVEFDSWEASPAVDDWIDKTVLELDKAKIERIEMSDLVLQRQDGQLSLVDLTDGAEADVDAIRELVDALTGLRIQSLLGTEAKPEYKQDEPELEIKLARSDAEPLTYRFSKPEDESYYVLKRSDWNEYFKLPEYSVKPILESTRETLVQEQADETPVEMTEETEATESPE